jgi:L-malate glycosyltransferase
MVNFTHKGPPRKPLRILQLVTRRQYRGAEVSAANLSAMLSRYGHEVLFLGLYPPPEENPLCPDGCTCLDLKGEKKGAFSLKRLLQLQRVVKSFRPDIIQANGSDNLKYTALLQLLFRTDAKLVYRLISMPSFWLGDSAIKQTLYKSLYKRFDQVVGVGQMAIQELQEVLHVPKEKCTVIYRGIPAKEMNKAEARKSLLSELKLGPEARLLVSAGALSPEKDQSFLVDVMDKLRREKKDVHLILAGEGPERAALSSQINALQLGQHIHLIGYQKDISRWLAGADVCLLSSNIEGVPGVLMEAALQGTPSIAIEVGGVGEVVESGLSGILLQKRNSDLFAKEVIKLLADPKRMAHYGHRAKAIATTTFDLEASATAFEGLYYQLIPTRKQ